MSKYSEGENLFVGIIALAVLWTALWYNEGQFSYQLQKMTQERVHISGEK